jgi:hypothetical protein
LKHADMPFECPLIGGVASGMRTNRILDRASGHRCGKGRHWNDGGDSAPEFHGLATMLLVMLITSKPS